MRARLEKPKLTAELHLLPAQQLCSGCLTTPSPFPSWAAYRKAGPWTQHWTGQSVVPGGWHSAEKERIKQQRAPHTLVCAVMQTRWGCSLVLTSGRARREQRERICLSPVSPWVNPGVVSCEQPSGGAAFPGLLGPFPPPPGGGGPPPPPPPCPPLGLSCPLLPASCLETACGCSCPGLRDGWSHPAVSVRWSVLSVNGKNSKGEWTSDDYTWSFPVFDL